METVQITTKKGGYITGETIMYTGNFAIVLIKEVKDGKLITTHKTIALEDIANINVIRDAEVRELPKPQLLVEGVANDCLCGDDCKC
jgi:hypothetical protein